MYTYLVPETAWTRHIMRFNSEHIFKHDWSELERFRPHLTNVASFRKTPEYFHRPLHGFEKGGPCTEQALQQSPSMRFIMRFFQCDDYYREARFHDVIENIDISDGIAVDIGCGSGDSTIALSKNVPNPIIGFDLSRAMVKLARKRTSDSNIRFHTADAANLPLPSQSVAITTCFAVLHEMPRYYARNVLNECARITKPGGYIIIWDQNPERIGELQHTSEIPIEPYLMSYKHLNIPRELEKNGCTVHTQPDRFMQEWIAHKH